MRRLLPDPAADGVDPTDVYADFPPVAGRPTVRLNMIASVDGATALDGRSGGLGGEADRRVFHTLRALTDVILVGATTVRAEHYGPGVKPIAVVSRSCRLDWTSRLFTAAATRTVVFTTESAAPNDRRQAAEVADVLICGETDVDLGRAVAILGERGYAKVLGEGGPTLNSHLAAADLVDELCLTVSPRLVGTDAKRLLTGEAPAPPGPLVLRSLCEEDGFLFLRYLTER